MTAGPDSVTVTPGSTPPWSSVTLPTNSPNIWPVCAAAGASPKASTMAAAARARMIARVTDHPPELTFSGCAGQNSRVPLVAGGKVHGFSGVVHREFEQLD